MGWATTKIRKMRDPSGPTGGKVPVLDILGNDVSASRLIGWLSGLGYGSQKDIAEEMGISNGYLSRLLYGKRSWNSGKAKTHAARWLDDKLAASSREWSYLFPEARAAQKQAAKTVADSLTESLEEAAEKDTGPQGFPLPDAQEIFSRIRKAASEGEIHVTASLRKLINWGRSYNILKEDAELDHESALAAAFWVTAVFREEDETRQTLLEIYQRVLGHDAEDPMDLIPHDNNQHPMEPLVEIFARKGMHVWAFGPTGCGKTFAAKRIANRLSGGFVRFQGDRDRNVDDFVGAYGAKDGSTFVYEGPLPRSMKNGMPLILDEPTVCDNSVLMSLQAVLEGDKLTLTKGEGSEIEPEDGFVVLACDNSRGLGEAVEYVGTDPVNEALRDRFLFVEFGYMPQDQELGIAESEIEQWRSGIPSPTEKSDGQNPSEDTGSDLEERN